MQCCRAWLQLFCVCVLQANGVIVEVEPLCVLDFYVHESYQRQGVGKALFEVKQLPPQLCLEACGHGLKLAEHRGSCAVRAVLSHE